MNIKVNQQALRESFLDNNDKLSHHSGKLIKLFPFVTNKSKKDIVLKELVDFCGITGKALRLLFKKELPCMDNVLERLMDAIKPPEENDVLKNILLDVCFDDNNNMSKFNKKALLYQDVQNPHPTLNNFSEYIYEIFLKDIDIDLTDVSSELILDRLLELAIPELKEKPTNKKSNYYLGFAQIRELFRKDVLILMKDDRYFIENIDNFLKYYLYFYLTQMFFSLKNFGEDNSSLRNCFYSVDWESLSESRDAYKFGMKLFKGQNAELFPHVICLELLHYIEGLKIDKFTYSELRLLVCTLNPPEIQALSEAVNEIYKFYTSYVTDVSWDDFENSYKSPNYENLVFDAIDKLIGAIRYQFDKSSRHSARDGYGSWLIDYGQCNFGKMRGRLGWTHVLSQDILLLFIKISIGNSKDARLRLSDLWIELERRGLSFDQYSRTEIIHFLDKNNMLEKKSDSGDAQYVTVQE